MSEIERDREVIEAAKCFNDSRSHWMLTRGTKLVALMEAVREYRATFGDREDDDWRNRRVDARLAIFRALDAAEEE